MTRVGLQERAQLVDGFLSQRLQLDRVAEAMHGVTNVTVLTAQLLYLSSVSLSGDSEQRTLLRVQMLEKILLERGPAAAQLGGRKLCVESVRQMEEQQLMVFVVLCQLFSDIQHVLPTLAEFIVRGP